jgi:hypothetical protein
MTPDWYVTEDMSTEFVPVRTTPSYAQARHVASVHAREIGGDWTRIKYRGRRDVELTDHEAGCDCDKDGCNRRTEPCYVFEGYEP